MDFVVSVLVVFIMQGAGINWGLAIEGKKAFAFSISLLHSYTHTHTAHTMI